MNTMASPLLPVARRLGRDLLAVRSPLSPCGNNARVRKGLLDNSVPPHKRARCTPTVGKENPAPANARVEELRRHGQGSKRSPGAMGGVDASAGASATCCSPGATWSPSAMACTTDAFQEPSDDRLLACEPGGFAPASPQLALESIQHGRGGLLHGEHVLLRLRALAIVTEDGDTGAGGARPAECALDLQDELLVTNYAVRVQRRRPCARAYPLLWCMPLLCIERMDAHKLSDSSSGTRKLALVQLACHDVRKVACAMHADDAKELKRVLQDNAFSSLFKHSRIFASVHRLRIMLPGSTVHALDARQGWETFATIEGEIERSLGCSAARFAEFGIRRTALNSRYELCKSYPSQLYVPVACSDEELAACAAFRTKGRLPALTWISHGGGAAIWRSSQPKAGMLNSTSAADDKLVLALCSAGMRLSETADLREQGLRLRIVDCRPKVNAVANRARGGGHSYAGGYTERCGVSVSVDFMGIENIHAMSSSLAKLKMACTSACEPSSSTPWLVTVEQTKWLHHLRTVLLGSASVAATVLGGTSVLVHCSDGWDRTSQLCALSQLMLDGRCRTTLGFCRLIEKDWIRFGHRFRARVHLRDSENNSPVFLQFLDCCWQLLQIFPSAFEFSSSLLVMIADSIHSGCFGTFLTNCEHDKAELAPHMPSLWALVELRAGDHVNFKYVPSTCTSTIIPSTVQVHRIVSLWAPYWLRFAAAGHSLPS